ncbi:MAG: radical SAM protein [Candidatus Saelkia tenebricola]|nr:radical SAM protein [Candidatus Saelkia tenebricola]
MSKILRKTKSLCPECLNKIEAEIIEEDNKIFLKKNCPTHGDFRLLISNHPYYYKQLQKVYFYLIKKSFPQRDFLVHLTSKCNLNCSMCLANANVSKLQDYPLSKLKEFLRGKKNYKIGLMGAEPTMRGDLPEIIKLVSESGNIAELHTNGIKIADFDYIKKLKQAGLKEVHLQFDGFSDEVYLKIRGKKLLNIKLKALDNLKKLGLSVDLKATIVKGVNEKEMAGILEFALKHSNIKEVFFLGCRFLGKGREISSDSFYMPDELIDALEAQSPELIKRDEILKFEKLYYLLLWFFSSRKCFYNQHYLILRDNNKSISDIVNLNFAERKIDKMADSAKQIVPIIVIFKIVLGVINFRTIKYLLKFVKLGSLLKNGFNVSLVPKDFLLLGFISACDRFSFDEQIAMNCGKGAMTVELGITEVGARDNIMREKFWDEDSCPD